MVMVEFICCFCREIIKANGRSNGRELMRSHLRTFHINEAKKAYAFNKTVDQKIKELKLSKIVFYVTAK